MICELELFLPHCLLIWRVVWRAKQLKTLGHVEIGDEMAHLIGHIGKAP